MASLATRRAGVPALALSLLALGQHTNATAGRTPSATHARPPSLAAFVGRCAPNTPEHTEATLELAELDRRIEALAPSTSVGLAVAVLRAITSSRCFELAAAQPQALDEIETARTLQTWWNDGGREWLSSFLHTPDDADDRGTVVIPADPRADWSLERHRDDPLAPLLCSWTDAHCGTESRPWLARATETFRSWARRIDTEDGEIHASYGLGDQCGRRILSGREPERYVAFVRCLEAGTPQGITLPIGHFRAPTTGWLILRGYGGYFDPTVDLRMLDLETGTAWMVRRSIKLIPTADGQGVDSAATAAAARYEIVTGSVAVASLRETALMTFLAPSLTTNQRVLAGEYQVPSRIVPRVRAGASYSGDRGGPSAIISDEGQWNYAWIVDGSVRLHGSFHWDDQRFRPDDYFSELIDGLQDSLVEGCAPAPLPSREPDRVAMGIAVRPDNAVDPLWQHLAEARNRVCAASGNSAHRP